MIYLNNTDQPGPKLDFFMICPRSLQSSKKLKDTALYEPLYILQRQEFDVKSYNGPSEITDTKINAYESTTND